MNKQITQDDVIYFVVTDRFFGRNKRSADPADASVHGGTLDGVVEKLDYLLGLGVTAVWVTPVYENIKNAGASEPYHYYWPRRFDRLDARLHDGEPPGVLDNDNPLKGGYRNANRLVTLLDNHDLERRIMSHARTKHAGEGAGLDWAIRTTKLCLGALFTMRGIPQLYYGTEVGLEGWKAGGDDRDLRRDFPWHVFAGGDSPQPQFRKEREIFDWTRGLIELRKSRPSLKYGTTVTLWSDDLVYAFLRVATDDVSLVIINNGYERMPHPIRLTLNPAVVPRRVADTVAGGLKHWASGQTLAVQDGQAVASVDGKTIDIFCAGGS